jgi:hypothetical protein
MSINWSDLNRGCKILEDFQENKFRVNFEV